MQIAYNKYKIPDTHWVRHPDLPIALIGDSENLHRPIECFQVLNKIVQPDENHLERTIVVTQDVLPILEKHSIHYESLGIEEIININDSCIYLFSLKSMNIVLSNKMLEINNLIPHTEDALFSLPLKNFVSNFFKRPNARSTPLFIIKKGAYVTFKKQSEIHIDSDFRYNSNERFKHLLRIETN